MFHITMNSEKILEKEQKLEKLSPSFLCSFSHLRFQVVKMLACVVLIFATLWVPYRGMLVYNTITAMNKMKPFMDLWYLMFAKTCIYINRSANANVSHN